MGAVAHAADRRAMLAKVAIARKQLAMADESYRAMLLRLTGQDSAAKLDHHGLHKVLEEFKRFGFNAEPRKSASAPRPMSPQAQIRKIYAIWNDLQPFLAVRDDIESLRSFVRRQTKDAEHPNGISAPEFLRAEQANKVVEGLKAWLARVRRQALQTRAGGRG